MTRRELIEAFIPHSPHAAALGISLAGIGTDEAVLEMPYKPELATIGDVVHGGAIGTLIDTAAMAAAWASDEETDSPAGATIALSVNFVGAARGCDLRAAARVTKRGRELSFCEVEVSDPDSRSPPASRLTASARGTVLAREPGIGNDPRRTAHR